MVVVPIDEEEEEEDARYQAVQHLPRTHRAWCTAHCIVHGAQLLWSCAACSKNQSDLQLSNYMLLACIRVPHIDSCLTVPCHPVITGQRDLCLVEPV